VTIGTSPRFGALEVDLDPSSGAITNNTNQLLPRSTVSATQAGSELFFVAFFIVLTQLEPDQIEYRSANRSAELPA
jgi:hypothetical protein